MGIQGYEHPLEQIARVPRLGSLSLACGGAESVVLQMFDSVTSTPRDPITFGECSD